MREDIDIAAHGWVRRGLVWHNPALVASRIPDDVEPDVEWHQRKRTERRHSSTCSDCPARIEPRFVRCRECWKSHRAANRVERISPLTDVEQVVAVLGRTLAADVARRICEHCDCLLAYPGETCPGCLAWAELNACQSSWKAVRVAYKPSRNDVTEVAA